MKRWAWLLLLAACATAITTTTGTSTTVELIPSSTVTATVTATSTTAPPEPTVSDPPVTVTVAVAPPLVTAVATTVPVTTRPPTVPTSPPITITPEIAVVFSAPSEALLIASTNLVRTSIGLPALIPHADLDFYARVWAGHLSQVGDLAHSNIGVLLGPWLIVGENVAVGVDMGSVASALAASPDHYGVMVNPSFTHTGIGVAVDAAGRLWVCQVFGGTVLHG